MSSDGFSTLSAGLMERGTSRVRAVLGNGAALKQPIDAPQPKQFANAAPSPQPAAGRPAFGTAKRQNASSFAEDGPIEAPKPGLNGAAANLATPASCTPQDAAPPAPPAKPEQAASKAAEPKAVEPKALEPKALEPKTAEPKKMEHTSRRGNSGSTLMISQPPSGDMSEVTISLWGAKPETTDTPSKNGQRPTSVTYERCTLEEHGIRETETAEGEGERQLWIDTPTFSGPDRRHMSVSPEVERRKTVPPRLKVGVRLEQERYLRLKLATQDTGRTQQDIITSALDTYLDEIGVDRFVRIAMGFGGATPSVGPDADTAEQLPAE